MSFDIILPFLRPIATFIEDPGISEIMVNPGGGVFVERDGRVTPAHGVRLDERNLRVAVRNIARLLGDDISDEQPILDARLPDGSRVAAVMPPCSLHGTALTIRKFRPAYFTVEELVASGTLSQGMADALCTALIRRHNILISGGTGTGKTTLLNALTACLPPDERVVVVEETAELRTALPNVLRLEARRAQRDRGPVTVRDLLRATLRHRPDRILVGEVRGGEAYDLLQALNTGHAGSLCTIHASSAMQALARFTSCVLQADVEVPYKAVRHQIGEAVQVVVHMTRSHGMRVASELLEVGRYLPDEDRFESTVHTVSGAAIRSSEAD
ncbi:MAG: ATPase, T2SS/T4P/T4SS family [Gemmatimonadaceae bacterium]